MRCGTPREQEGISGHTYIRHYSLKSFNTLIVVYKEREPKLLFDFYNEFHDEKINVFFTRAQLDLVNYFIPPSLVKLFEIFHIKQQKLRK